MATLTPIQQFKIGPITGLDRKGNPAPIDLSSLTLELDTPGLVTIEADPDGDAATRLVKGVAGTTGGGQIHITVDVDMSDGVVPKDGFVGVNVVPEQAASLVIPEGPVTDQ